MIANESLGYFMGRIYLFLMKVGQEAAEAHPSLRFSKCQIGNLMPLLKYYFPLFLENDC